jgi:hypothetical protein
MSTQVSPIDQNTIRRRGTGLRGLDPDRAFPGYTLFTPLTGQGDVFLIDLEGQVVHQWTLPYRPGLHGYLLPNGNLFYGGKGPEDRRFFPVWSNYRGGILAEVDPQGTILWEQRSPDHHHDARRLRNGNVVLLGLEKIPRAFVPHILGGIPGSEVHGDIYGDVVREITPAGTEVWAWRAHEHLDPALEVIHPQDGRHHWPMANAVSELRDGSLALSFRNVSTVVIIDRTTGDVTWRLGHDVLAQQHDSHELPNGNLLIFDNGAYRHQSWLTYSRVIEVSLQTKEIVWEYMDKPPQNFFSSYISSAQRLPNGNTLITEGAFGRIFEVTPAGETVWEYVVPYFAPWQVPGEPVPVAHGEQNAIFRALRYAREQIPWL